MALTIINKRPLSHHTAVPLPVVTRGGIPYWYIPDRESNPNGGRDDYSDWFINPLLTSHNIEPRSGFKTRRKLSPASSTRKPIAFAVRRKRVRRAASIVDSTDANLALAGTFVMPTSPLNLE